MAGEYIDSCKGKAFAVLFFVFVGGMAAGALSLKVYQRYGGAEVVAMSQRHQHQPTLAVERLRQELNLNETQFVEVQSVLDECIMKEADLLTQLALTRTDGRVRIMRILDESQQQKFDTLLRRVSTANQED
jgi:hypothetical protein